ncbi:MAG: type IV toxin-antitoxin system AbiEi family antitoxin domain-containing protein, partial [Candidatus Cryptobacteroides sp.]
MKASDIISQFATSEGGSFRKSDLMSHMEGGSFSTSYIDLSLNRMVKAGKLLREGRGLYRVKDDRREFLPS